MDILSIIGKIFGGGKDDGKAAEQASGMSPGASDAGMGGNPLAGIGGFFDSIGKIFGGTKK